jgi:hypothetical protein
MATQKRTILLTAFQGIVATVYLGFTGLALASEQPSYARFPAILAAGAIAAIAFRQGWLIPCTLAGPIAGVISMPAVRGGPIDAQMEEDVFRIVFCTVVGCLLGFSMDVSRRAAQREAAEKDVADREQPPTDSFP